MASPKKQYTEEQRFKCIALFARTELRKGESFINNSDAQIAKEIGLKKHTVSNIISKYLKTKRND